MIHEGIKIDYNRKKGKTAAKKQKTQIDTKNKKYRVGIGLKEWTYFYVNASSNEKALKKARKLYEDGKNYMGEQTAERDEELDTVEEN